MDNKFIGLVSIFFLVFGVFISVLFFNKNIATLTRAKEDTLPSAEKSIILVYPLTVNADGTTTSTATVVVRNSKGDGLEAKPVTLTTSLGAIDGGQPTLTKNSEKDGHATFAITSSTAGVANLSVLISGSTSTSNTASINFISP
jgi:hypothetical protein